MGKNGTNAGRGAVKNAWFYTLTTHKPISHIELSQDVIMTAIGTAALVQHAGEKMTFRASTVEIAGQMAVKCVLVMLRRITNGCRARDTAYGKMQVFLPLPMKITVRGGTTG